MDEADTLWHYTDARGLLGIIKDSCLRATDASYLNDDDELKYIQRTFENREPNEDIRGRTDDLRAILAWLWSGDFDVAVRPPERGPYITSFCANGDLLSQWRGYANGSGYAIGFDRQNLATLSGAKLVKVIYEPRSDEWLKVASESETLTEAGYKRTIIPPDEVIARYKNPSFIEEKEWRLVTSAKNRSQDDLKFRESIHGISPFYEIEFPLTCITNICVGPGHDRELRMRAVDQLTSTYKMSIHIESSDAPFKS